MGYANDRAVSGGEMGMEGGLEALFSSQFAPSSTIVAPPVQLKKKPGLGATYSVGITPVPVDSSPTLYSSVPKISWSAPVATAPLYPSTPTAPAPAPTPTPVPVSTTPTPAPVTAPTGTVSNPIVASQPTSQQAADNSTTLAQQAAAAQASGNTALAQSLTAQSVQWGNISAAMSTGGASGSVVAPNVMGVDTAEDSSAVATVPAVSPPIGKEVVYAGLGVVALLLLLRH